MHQCLCCCCTVTRSTYPCAFLEVMRCVLPHSHPRRRLTYAPFYRLHAHQGSELAQPSNSPPRRTLSIRHFIARRHTYSTCKCMSVHVHGIHWRMSYSTVYLPESVVDHVWIYGPGYLARLDRTPLVFGAALPLGMWCCQYVQVQSC